MSGFWRLFKVFECIVSINEDPEVGRGDGGSEEMKREEERKGKRIEKK